MIFLCVWCIKYQHKRKWSVVFVLRSFAQHSCNIFFLFFFKYFLTPYTHVSATLKAFVIVIGLIAVKIIFNLKQNEAQSACAESTHKGANQRLKHTTQGQQRRESPTAVTWIACKCKVHKLMPVHTCVAECARIVGYIYMCVCVTGGHPFSRMYLWCSLCSLYLCACQVRVAVGDLGLCCCACVACFKQWLAPLWEECLCQKLPHCQWPPPSRPLI